MTKGGPCWAVLWVDGDQLDVVFDGCLVLSTGGAVLSKLVDSVDVDEVVALTFRQVGLDVGGVLHTGSRVLVLLVLLNDGASHLILSLRLLIDRLLLLVVGLVLVASLVLVSLIVVLVAAVVLVCLVDLAGWLVILASVSV